MQCLLRTMLCLLAMASILLSAPLFADRDAARPATSITSDAAPRVFLAINGKAVEPRGASASISASGKAGPVTEAKGGTAKTGWAPWLGLRRAFTGTAQAGEVSIERTYSNGKSLAKGERGGGRRPADLAHYKLTGQREITARGAAILDPRPGVASLHKAAFDPARKFAATGRGKKAARGAHGAGLHPASKPRSAVGKGYSPNSQAYPAVLPPAMRPAAPGWVRDWQGWYVGARFGLQRLRGFSALLPPEDNPQNASGLSNAPNSAALQQSIGAYLGYNYAFADGVIIGGELSVQKRRLSAFSPRNLTPYMSYKAAAVLYSPWEAMAQLHVGLAINRFMPYLALGMKVNTVRYADLSVRTQLKRAAQTPAPDQLDEIKEVDIKAALSVGVNYKMSEHLLLRAEYNYWDSELYKQDATLAVGVKAKQQSELISLGLTYKF